MAWSSLIVAVPAKQRRSEHLSHLPPESSTVRPATLLRPCCSLAGRSARSAGAAVAQLMMTPQCPRSSPIFVPCAHECQFTCSSAKIGFILEASVPCVLYSGFTPESGALCCSISGCKNNTVRPAALHRPCCSLGGRSARRAGAAIVKI